MSTPPVQQVLLAARAQRKRPLKLGPYKLAGSAKRLAERRLVDLVRDLVSDLEARVLELVPEVPETLLDDVKTDAAPSPLDLRPLLKSRTDLYVRRLTAQVDPSLSEAEREQRAAEKRVVSPLGIDVIGGEPWLKKELTGRGKEFSQLCVDLARETERRIASASIEALEKGHPRKWLRRQIQEAGGIGERRAKLIARDQVGKLQGALHEARQKDLGIESYVWRTSRDERVAGNPGGAYPDAISSSPTHGDHHEREGRRFSWKKEGGKLLEVLKDGTTRGTVYVDGHPGDPIQCRCFAEPVIVGLEDLQDLDRPAPVASRYKVR